MASRNMILYLFMNFCFIFFLHHLSSLTICILRGCPKSRKKWLTNHFSYFFFTSLWVIVLSRTWEELEEIQLIEHDLARDEQVYFLYRRVQVVNDNGSFVEEGKIATVLFNAYLILNINKWNLTTDWWTQSSRNCVSW